MTDEQEKYNIEFDLPEKSTKGFLKRQRKMIRFMARYTRASANIQTIQAQDAEERDMIALADAMDDFLEAQGSLVDYLALFVTDPEDYDAKIDALEDLSEDEYNAISAAILNPEGDDEEGNPTE